MGNDLKAVLILIAYAAVVLSSILEAAAAIKILFFM
jgi:hypothetical protein